MLLSLDIKLRVFDTGLVSEFCGRDFDFGFIVLFEKFVFIELEFIWFLVLVSEVFCLVLLIVSVELLWFSERFFIIVMLVSGDLGVNILFI